ncbi:host specificity protein J [Jeongeupia naejangsanensis]|uniref:Host specificity protein J n=1 Tax=Jeongeupia naejangsanensis TaxID=613195 RepID=A0ABS2BG00_9NEIS|nr:phage tail protein [Jeongeupia naejangsanensis]MBM3114540.1 host specificity protein J [Jeongeupia naejangsanensis]
MNGYPVLLGAGGDDPQPAQEAPNTLRSCAYARITDLVSEGEIGGLVSGMQSVYFDEVPVQNPDGSYNFSGVSFEFRPGTQSQPVLSITSGTEHATSVGVELKAGQAIERRIDNTEADSARVTLQVNQLTSQDMSSGDLNGTSVDLLVEVQPVGGAWQAVPGASSWHGMPVTGATGASRYQLGVDCRVASNHTQASNGSGMVDVSVKTTFVISWRLNGGDWYVVQQQELGLNTTLVVDVQANPADVVDFSVSATASGRYTTEPSWTINYVQGLIADGRVTISGKTTSPYARDVSFRLPGEGPWNVRVTRLTADSTQAALQDKTYWQALTDIVDDKLRYPNSALCALAVDASQFSSVPTRAYDLYGLLISVPSNYDPLARSYSGSWDGTFKIAWSDNPAWVFYDLVTHPRYGLGDYVPEALVDQWALYEIAQYCDELVPDGFGGMEPRFTCNLYLQTRQDAYQVLSDLAGVFRGMAYWSAGGVGFAQDAPKAPSYQFTNANVAEAGFSYAGAHRNTIHNAVLVTWNDPANLCKQAVEYVEDAEAIIEAGYLREANIVAIGCSSRGMARRVGKWLLYTERYEADSVSFTTGLEGCLPQPGDVIRISDCFRTGERRGGRIGRDSTAEQIVLDAPVTVPAGTLRLALILDDGSLQERELQRPLEVETRTVIPVTPFERPPAIGSSWILASDDLVPELYRVTTVTEQDDGSYQVEGLRHYPDKYALIEEGEPFELPDNDNISLVPGPVGQLSFAEVLYEATAGSVRSKVLVSWSPLRNDLVRGYQLAYRREHNDWVQFPETASTSVEVLDTVPGWYDFRIVAVNVIGVRGAPTGQGVELYGLTSPPAPLAGLDVSALNGVGWFSWPQSQDLDVRVGGSIRFRFSPKLQGATWNESVDIGANLPGASTQAQLPLLVGTYLAKPVDASGIEALDAVAVSTASAAIAAYNAVERFDADPDFAGLCRNTAVIDAGVQLDSADTVDDWPVIDSMATWDSGTAGVATEGEWIGSEVIDLGAVMSCRLTAELASLSWDVTDLVDARPDIDAVPDWDGTISDANAAFFVSVSDDDPASNTWQPWQPFFVGDWRGRAFRFRMALQSANPLHNVRVTRFRVTLDMPDRLESGEDVPIPAEGRRLDFSQRFHARPALALTVQGLQPGEIYQTSARDTAGFFIRVVDACGQGIARSIDWIAKGYGAEQ